jgi:hypothetical protein
MHEGTRLRGPADPDQFRVRIGSYRHYFDNLPACDLAPATDATWPAVSSVKNAAGKDWSYVTMGRIAAKLAAEPDAFKGKPEKAIYNDLVALNKSELDRAQGRGTDVHQLLEAKAFGGDVMLTVDAEPYRAAVEQFLADCQPDIFLSEVVVINRTLGYGGTGDAWAIINHPDLGRILLDWKTRSGADKHAAYDEECWQVGGAYFHGEYMIVEENGQAVRRPLPELDGAGIVSIAPEGYKIIPIKIPESWTTFQALYGFWKSKAGVSFSGNPIYIRRATPAAADSEQVAKLRKAVEWIKAQSPAGLAMLAANWPDGVPTFTAGGPTTIDHCTSLALVVEKVNREANVPFDPEPAEPTPPLELQPTAEVQAEVDEGESVIDDEVQTLAILLSKLPQECQDWINGLAFQAHSAGHSISVRQRPSERRYQIVRGLIALAPHGEDELLRAVVALTVNDDTLTSPAMPAGAVVGSLDVTEAAAFAALCEQYAANGLPTVVGTDGRLRVQRAAA